MSVEIIEVTTFNLIEFLALVIVIIISWVITSIIVMKLFMRIKTEYGVCHRMDEAEENASRNLLSMFMYFLLFIFYAIGCGVFMNEQEFANSVKIKISITLLVWLVPVNMLNEFSKDG